MKEDLYVSPFSTRYCSPEMSRLFSANYKAKLFRKLWIELAKAEKKFGLPISDGQIQQMIDQVDHIDFDLIATYEKQFRHDIMAHIHAYGDACPEAKPIIHLGATSSYVTDNGDLIQLKEALALLLDKTLHIVNLLSALAQKHATDPTLSFTHFQPAQPTTIGKRICLWLQDFYLDAKEFKRLIDELPFLGVKGATGTQSSFLALLNGDHKKVVELEKEIASAFGFSKILPIAGQTYTRKLDIIVLNSIESFAASAHKFATDFRLLSHEEEFFEPFGSAQVGSSAMPYKRNPIYSERICGLARFAISLSQNPAYTAATQWLERSLDDSSNKRLSIPEAFLSADAILNLMSYILTNPEIRPEIALNAFEQNLPILCMENILMESVKRGASRQDMHEKLKNIAFAAMKSQNTFESLAQSIEREEGFKLTKAEVLAIGNPKTLIGRAPEQVREFLEFEIHPFLKSNPIKDRAIGTVEI
jgi:adenylosuccinate lyase